MIAAIRELTFKKPVDLYNIDQINTGMTDGEINDLEKYIGESLSANSKYKDKNGVKVLVRPASFGRKEQDGVALYRFLIDIDEFRDTYEVSFGLFGDKGFYEPPTIKCPLPAQMKYPETNCSGQRTEAFSSSVFELELPYYFRMTSGQFVIVTSKYAADGQEYLEVKVSSCGDNGIIDAARVEVENWIKAQGQDSSGYEIKVPEFCDGGAN